MALSDTVLLSAVFAGVFVVAYTVWEFIRGTRKEMAGRPPTIWSIRLLASYWFCSDFRWHGEFLRMSTKIGNVFAFYMGSRYVHAFCRYSQQHCVPLFNRDMIFFCYI